MLRCLLVTAVLLIAPAPASGATVAVTTFVVGERGGNVLHQRADYTAGPGEANDLVVRADGSAVTFRDDGAAITPGAGCVAEDEHAVRCTFRVRIPQTEVDLADGDDRARVDPSESATSVHIVGGEGADTLDGAEHGNGLIFLAGGPGDDRIVASASVGTGLHGDAGDDELVGAAGEDSLDGGLGDDVIDGGPGLDDLRYADRDAGVWIDLELGSGGGTGERDVVAGVEVVRGTSGPDVLLGGPGSDSLYGYSGRDLIAGRGGSDHLYGYAGGDTLIGGPGRDELLGSVGSDVLDGGEGDDALSPGRRGRTGDRLACGTGADEINAPWRPPFPLLPADCERFDENVVRLRSWSVQGRWLRTRVALGHAFRGRGSCTLTLATARDERRFRRLRYEPLRTVRLRVPAGEIVALRVTPVSRCLGWKRPLLLRLAAAATGR